MKKIVWVFLSLFAFLFLFSGIAHAQTAPSALCDESDPSGIYNPNTPTTSKIGLGLVPCGKAVKDTYSCSYVSNYSLQHKHYLKYYNACMTSADAEADCNAGSTGSGNLALYGGFCRRQYLENNPGTDWDWLVANSVITGGKFYSGSYVICVPPRAACECWMDVKAPIMSTADIYADTQTDANNKCKVLSVTPDNPLLNVAIKLGSAPKCPCELAHIFILILNIYKFVVWFIALPLAGLLIMIGGALLLVGGGYPKLHEMGKRILWGAVWGIALILGSWLIIGAVFWALGFTGTWWASFTF